MQARLPRPKLRRELLQVGGSTWEVPLLFGAPSLGPVFFGEGPRGRFLFCWGLLVWVLFFWRGSTWEVPLLLGAPSLGPVFFAEGPRGRFLFCLGVLVWVLFFGGVPVLGSFFFGGGGPILGPLVVFFFFFGGGPILGP